MEREHITEFNKKQVLADVASFTVEQRSGGATWFNRAHAASTLPVITVKEGVQLSARNVEFTTFTSGCRCKLAAFLVHALGESDKLLQGTVVHSLFQRSGGQGRLECGGKGRLESLESRRHGQRAQEQAHRKAKSHHGWKRDKKIMNNSLRLFLANESLQQWIRQGGTTAECESMW